MLGASLQCPGCRTWWSRRNFSFDEYNPLPNKGIPEVYGLVSEFSGAPLIRIWTGFDEDDGQAMEILAAQEPGWLFGEKFYKGPSSLHRDEDGVTLDLFVPEAAPIHLDSVESRLRNSGCNDAEIETYKRLRAMTFQILDPLKLAEKFLSLVVEKNREGASKV